MKEPSHQSLETFQSSRWIWRVNVLLQLALVLILFLGVNYLGMHHFLRRDLTRNGAYSLSAETLSYIHNLNEPVKIVVTINSDSENTEVDQAYNDVRGILREFSYASRDNPKGGIDVEFLNFFQQRRLAKEYNIQNENVVVFIAGDKQKTVTLPELYTIQDMQRRQFLGEKVFTAALLDVTSRKQPVIYFLTGHGEMRLNDVDPIRGLSQVEGNLRGRNYEVRPLDLTKVRKVPADASMVIIASPQVQLLPQEQEALRQYLNVAAGRLLVTISPGHKHGLDDLFYEWGIRTDNVQLVETDPNFLLPGGDILIRRFAKHPITQIFIDNDMKLVVGYGCSARADPGRPVDDSLIVTDLLESSDHSWGERLPLTGGPITFDPKTDLRGPLIVGAVSERKVDSRLGVSIPGGRLVVLGIPDFISNNRINSDGNLTFFLNIVNWALDRNSHLNIAARPVQRLHLTLSQDQLTYSRLGIVLGPPLLIALFGGLVFLARRR